MAEDDPIEGGIAQSFVVSAYYSPLPNQKEYVRGSYEADIRLNGNGTNGADGTPVYTGMLAAPKSYAFGTQIYIPGLGMGTVHDRGGAIIEKNGYHRIDVWMGYGDEGRIRALQWGMRSVEGKIFPIASAKESLPESIPVLSVPTVPLHSVNNELSYGSTGAAVKELQKKLQDANVYSGPISGYFGPQTKTAVIAFQKEKGIITAESDTGAGIVGPTTKTALESLFKKQEILASSETILPDFIFPEGMKIGQTNDGVKRLQNILQDFGYLEVDPTGYFGNKTQKALVAFQKEHGVITSEKEKEAGYFGYKTKIKLETVLANRREKTENIEAPKILAITGGGKTKNERKTVAVQNPPLPPLSKTFSSPLAYGSRGDAVKAIQEKLIAKGYLEAGLNTGFYGEKTQQAVIAFQQDAQMASVPQGVVEENTYQKIWS